MKKLFILSLLIILIASCSGNNKPAGRYQMEISNTGEVFILNTMDGNLYEYLRDPNGSRGVVIHRGEAGYKNFENIQ